MGGELTRTRRSLTDVLKSNTPPPPHSDFTSNYQYHNPQQLVTCKPDVLVYPSEISTDEFVLICCDGVWDVLTSQEAVTFIHECLIVKKIPDLQTCLDMLLDHCLDKGSNDNMTAAIIALPGFCRVHNYFKKPSSACNIS